MWAFADQGSYKMCLRRSVKNKDKNRQKAKKLQEINKNRFSEEILYKGFIDNILGFDSSVIEPEEDIVLEFE